MARVHEYEVLIRERHLDVFGHVNNAVYMDLFEEARWDLIVSNGYGIERIRSTAKGPVVLEASLRFQRELVQRRRIRIRSTLESYQGKIMKLRQTMIDDEDRVCCDASFTMGLLDLNARRLVLPTPEWLVAIGESPTPS
jgi:acyl-CoA thioester hydrolase